MLRMHCCHHTHNLRTDALTYGSRHPTQASLGFLPIGPDLLLNEIPSVLHIFSAKHLLTTQLPKLYFLDLFRHDAWSPQIPLF